MPSLRAFACAAVLLASSTLGGCATLRATVRGHDVGPGGITRPQLRLRNALVRGDFATALAWREDDVLLATLTRATSAYYAAQFARAGALLDTAALLADDRITASLSRNGLALITNDNARPYQARRTERLFIAYYGMLSYARLDDWEGAAVEARRMVSLLEQYGAERDADERALHGAMEYLAGVVFERAGRPDEARVAYRAAQAIHEAVAAERTLALSEGEGEVLVVLERGFVAHRVTEQVNVFVGAGEHHRHRHRHRRPGRHQDETTADRVARVLESTPDASRRRDPRGPIVADPRDSAGGTARDRRADHDDDDDGYWLALAMPSLRRTARPWGRDALIRSAGMGDTEVARFRASVHDAASVDERRDRVAMMARATARAAAKYAVTKAVKDRKGEAAGKLANIGASLLERADVRSWHLLPQEVQLLRMRAPAGTHSVRVEVRDGAASRVVEVGPVTIQAGRISLATVRVWRDPLPLPVVALR